MPDPLSKFERLTEVFRRLSAAPAAVDQMEARCLVAATLNAVEDELSGVPCNPATWRTDGRMYPVMDDNLRRVEGWPSVQRLASLGHDTYVSAGGAIEIRVKDGSRLDHRPGRVVFTKVGADGRGVWDER